MSKNVESNKNQKIKLVDNFLKFLLAIVFLFLLQLTLDELVDFSLSPRIYVTQLLLFIISTVLTLIAILLYIVPFFYNILVDKAKIKRGRTIDAKEQTVEMNGQSNILQIILGVVSISALVTLVVKIALMLLIAAFQLYS
ncbi:MAG: hypothetical protein ACTSYG_03100 [Candidatus Heimdallarchaeota archaeon]